MATVIIDNQSYDINSLSAEAQALQQSLQLADQKLVELQRGFDHHPNRASGLR